MTVVLAFAFDSMPVLLIDERCYSDVPFDVPIVDLCRRFNFEAFE